MRKLSPAEAGKLGGEKTRLISAQKLLEKISNYNLNPKLCVECSTPLVYEQKHNKFCGHSCAAIYNNSRRETKAAKRVASKENVTKSKTINGALRVEWLCVYCGKKNLSKPSQLGTYCNGQCHRDHIFKLKIDKWLTYNEKIGKGAIKRYLRETFGYKCSVCGIDNWCGKSIVLELEHKDGNSDNNHHNNLCLICPNCHSQTDTYKAKNKGNGRHSRRLRYAKGLSF